MFLNEPCKHCSLSRGFGLVYFKFHRRLLWEISPNRDSLERFKNRTTGKIYPPTRTHMHLLHTHVCSRVGKLKAWNKDYRMYVLDMRKCQLGKKSNENSSNYNNVALDFTSRLSEDFVLKKYLNSIVRVQTFQWSFAEWVFW